MKDKKDYVEPLVRRKKILGGNINMQLCGKLATVKTLGYFPL